MSFWSSLQSNTTDQLQVDIEHTAESLEIYFRWLGFHLGDAVQLHSIRSTSTDPLCSMTGYSRTRLSFFSTNGFMHNSVLDQRKSDEVSI
jgi:hypothetical protein